VVGHQDNGAIRTHKPDKDGAIYLSEQILWKRTIGSPKNEMKEVFRMLETVINAKATKVTGTSKSINHILLGEQESYLGKDHNEEYRYFVDFVCNGRHDGECDSNNPRCGFENIVVQKKYEDALKLAINLSELYQVPVVDERHDITFAPYIPFGMLKISALCLINVWRLCEGTPDNCTGETASIDESRIRENTGSFTKSAEVLVGHNGEPPEWCVLESDCGCDGECYCDCGRFFKFRGIRLFMDDMVDYIPPSPESSSPDNSECRPR